MIVTKIIFDADLKEFISANEPNILTIDDASSFTYVDTLIDIWGNFKIIRLDVPDVDPLQLLYDEAFERKENK